MPDPSGGVGGIKVGALLPTREAVLFGGSDARAVLTDANRAEEFGFDSIWVSDSLLARPRFDPLTLASAIAARTDNPMIGIAVLLPALRHPLLLAQAVGTVDRIATGRLVLGIGAGAPIPATQAEFEAMEIPFDERVARRDRAIEICRRLWSGDDVGSEEYWSFDPTRLIPTTYRPEGPPIWLGGEGPQTLKRAGRLYDGWLPYSPTADSYAAGLARVRGEAAGADRDPAAVEAAVYLTITIDEDPELALSTQRTYMEAYYDIPYELISSVQACHAGTMDSAVAWIQGYVKQGASHIVLRDGVPSAGGQVQRLAELQHELKASLASDNTPV
jgi:alkanesulfonate monooxygenase SsuD/methylene tetrahydromethanopterin reductase-like flavin-dependent oxidoreductase (luciferase family)